MAYGYSQVRSNVALLLIGKIEAGIKKLKGMQPTQYGVPGQPDIGGILAGGRHLGIEAKMMGNVPSDDQLAYRAMFERFGGLYILAYSVDDVDRALRGAGVPL